MENPPLNVSSERLDGFLLLDKPIGLSSHAVMKRVQRLLHAQKAGHTGSLDPLATGMLPICLGEATKFSRFLLEAKKAYRVKMSLGSTTTTGDSEGEILSSKEVPVITEKDLVELKAAFLGEQQQIPPMYSALKHHGQPLYRLARAGKTVKRKPRIIHIEQLDFHDTNSFTVVCSKGTYIRSLVESMGDYLGCGAYVTLLHRLWVDPFQQLHMINLTKLENLSLIERREKVFSILDLMSSIMPTAVLSLSESEAIKKGQAVKFPFEKAGWIGLSCEGQFLGIGETDQSGWLKPKRLIRSD